MSSPFRFPGDVWDEIKCRKKQLEAREWFEQKVKPKLEEKNPNLPRVSIIGKKWIQFGKMKLRRTSADFPVFHQGCGEVIITYSGLLTSWAQFDR